MSLPDAPLTALMTFRVLVLTKEAGVIIGKNGLCVAAVREKTGVKSGVLKVVMGCLDRILTVSGPVDATAEALALFAQALLDLGCQTAQTYAYFPLKPLCPPGGPQDALIRLLIPHSQMGTLIGKQGLRIKALQELFNVRMVALKDFLQDSTERVVEVQGEPKNIGETLKYIARCLIEDWHGATGTLYYVPQPKRRQPKTTFDEPGGVTQVVDFALEFVGCLIGKRGQKILEIRRVSGALILIAQEDNDNDERLFTISGSQYSVDKALSMLYQQILQEKARREEYDE